MWQRSCHPVNCPVTWSKICWSTLHLWSQQWNGGVKGLVRDWNPGPLAPKARIIPLDQRAIGLNPVPQATEFQVGGVRHDSLKQRLSLTWDISLLWSIMPSSRVWSSSFCLLQIEQCLNFLLMPSPRSGPKSKFLLVPSPAFVSYSSRIFFRKRTNINCITSSLV